MLMGEKNRETDIEIHYKDTFRAFSKDDDGVTQQWRFNKYYLNNQNIFRVYSCRRAEICDESSPRKGDSGHLFIKVFKHLSTNQSTGVKMNFAG